MRWKRVKKIAQWAILHCLRAREGAVLFLAFRPERFSAEGSGFAKRKPESRHPLQGE